MANNINEIFKAISPNQEQKDKILNAIERGENTYVKPRYFLRPPKPLTAGVLLAIIMGIGFVTVNAATNGELFNNIKQVIFQDGTEGEIQYISEDTAAMSVPNDQVHNWIVSESANQRLILEISGEYIDITDDMTVKGYYYYEFYLEDDEMLHELYIVKNAGEEGTERWYSQLEYIPELGASSRIGCSYPLGVLILRIGTDVRSGLGTLDAEMPQALKLYQEIMEAGVGTELTETDLWNKIDARWGEWRS